MDRVDRIVRLAARALGAPRAVFSPAGDASGDYAVASLCAIVRGADGATLGTLAVVDDVPRSWTDDDVETLNDLAKSLATEIELDHARAQIDDYVEQTQVLVQLATPDGHLLFVNRAWRAALGYDPREICAADIVAPDHRGAYLDAVKYALAGREVPPFETVFETVRGDRLVMRAVLRARFAGGVPVSVRGTFEDVTDRLRTDEAQTRLVEVLEATTDFVGIADMSGQAIYINGAGRALIGLDSDEDLASVTLRTVYTREARHQLMRTAIPTALRQSTWQGESTIRTRAGRVIHVSQVIVAHVSARGGWYFSTIMRDITAQKLLQAITDGMGEAEDLQAAHALALERLRQATGWALELGPEADVVLPSTADEDPERESKRQLVSFVSAQLGGLVRRKQAEDALKASEERFRRLAMASNDGVVITRNGRFLEVNAAFLRMSGLSDAGVPPSEIIDHIAPESRDEVLRRMRDNVEGTYFATFVRPDGSTFEAEVSAKPCIWNGLAARIAVVRDVTEWRRLNRMKNEFVSTVSHELRTPLTSIRGALGLLEGGVAGAMAPKAADLLRMARENSDRLIRLINELLDLDKIEAGKLDLKYETLTPSAIVRATLDGIAAMADEHKIRLAEHVEAHRSFSADRDRIVQVLTNLVSNAIKFSPAGSTVEVEATVIASTVVFAVHNEGPGIPEADLARLFTRFQQLDSGDNRRRGGTGLGLAISKAIVEQHGGRIGVRSEPHVRTTFWFEIPMSRAKRE